ncbi:MAG: type 4a pilus biogenesis protein PilO [Nitrospirota bacterium]
MDINEVFEKNKNNILNIGVILIAVFIAFQIYNGINEKINTLTQQKSNELKKNEATSEIAVFEKKINGYKKVLVKKDLGAVMDSISEIAKQCEVKVVSIKPEDEESSADYIKSSFALTINAPNYHALGNFISRIESYQDIYFIDELSIGSAGFRGASEDVGSGLKINLKISTIAYL